MLTCSNSAVRAAVSIFRRNSMSGSPSRDSTQHSPVSSLNFAETAANSFCFASASSNAAAAFFCSRRAFSSVFSLGNTPARLTSALTSSTIAENNSPPMQNMILERVVLNRLFFGLISPLPSGSVSR